MTYLSAFPLLNEHLSAVSVVDVSLLVLSGILADSALLWSLLNLLMRCQWKLDFFHVSPLHI